MDDPRVAGGGNGETIRPGAGSLSMGNEAGRGAAFRVSLGVRRVVLIFLLLGSSSRGDSVWDESHHVDSGLWPRLEPRPSIVGNPALPTWKIHRPIRVLLYSNTVVDRSGGWDLDISQRGKTKEDAVKCFDDFSLFRRDGFPRVAATAIKIRHRLPAARASKPPGGTCDL